MPSRRIMMAYIMSHQSRLPAEFQEVEYLESTGTQYIDSGYTSNIDVSIKADIMITETPQRWRGVFGNQSQWIIGLIEDEVGVRWVANANSMYRYTYTVNQKFNIYCGKDFCYIDEQSISSSSDSNSLIFGNILIGAAYSVNTKSSARFYNFKIYDNDILVRNFIPCYRKADNVAGLYDLVNGVFYTNAGTGTFVVGGNV